LRPANTAHTATAPATNAANPIPKLANMARIYAR
jgi:hypothetical protein